MNNKRITALLLAALLSASCMTGCGINKNATLATMGDTKVSMGLGNFFCRYYQASVEDMYKSYFGDDVWSSDLYGNGSTMEDNLKDTCMDTLHDMETLSQADHMEEYGVELTADEETAITEAAEAFMSDNSADALKEMGATEELVEEYLRIYTIEQKMITAIKATADTEVTDEEANMKGYSVLYMSTDSYYDSSSGSYVDYTDDEIADITEQMQAMADDIAGGATMEEAADAAGATVDTDTYDADDTDIDEAVKYALDSMQEGETSGLITGEDGLYIVRLDTLCDEDATESNRESIISQRQSDKYDEVLSGWQEDDGWKVNEKQLAKISYSNSLTTTTESTETETEDTESVETTEQ